MGLMKNPNFIFTIIVLLFIIILLLIPTGFSTNVYPNSVRTIVRIIEVDNSQIYTAGGLINQGEQICKVEVIYGSFKGIQGEAMNRFTGRLDFDKIFVPGDRAFAAIDYRGEIIRHITLIDHFRIDLEFVLFGIFVLLLILYGRWTGLKALISFVLTILMIWKILIPFMLRGYNPILISLIVVFFLTIIVLLLIGGLNRKSLAAILGSLSGTILTCILAILFSRSFKIHGSVLSFSEPLLYAGYAHLNLTAILTSVVFIASAGALMDLAMDISASVYELVQKNPDLTTKEAIHSGFTIGKVVVGTMTTTLLFAYTGGYLALLMVFMAQGTPVVDILNLRYVSKEIMHTIVGSFGLVTVGPFTAIISGLLFARREER